MILLSLTGEFVLPPILLNRVIQPDEHILLHTKINAGTTQRIKNMLSGVSLECIPDDDFHAVLEKIGVYSVRPGCILDLSGGSRLEALAGFEAARNRLLPFVYLKKDGFRYKFYRFEFPRSLPQQMGCSTISGLITIKDYLIAHGQTPLDKMAFNNPNEEALERWIRWRCDEILTNQNLFGTNVNFVLRRGNQVGLSIYKSQEKYFYEGVDQLATLGMSGRFGDYTGLLLILNRLPDAHLEKYAKEKKVELAVMVGKKDATNGKIAFDPVSQRKLEKVFDDVIGLDWIRPQKPNPHHK